jgi:two-component system, LytTR family, response regulator
MAISILIVEDETVIAQDIKAALLAKGYKVCGIARTCEKAVDMIMKLKPDFALIDITLQKSQAGIEVGKLCQQLQIPFVYATSHSDIGTLEKVKITHPWGYLLKPFNRESMYAVLEIAFANFASRKDELRPDEQVIQIRMGEEMVRLRYNELLFLESDGNYTHFQSITSKYTERKSMKELLDAMPDHPFVRVHKSFAINKHKAGNYSRTKLFIADFEIPIGRAYADDVHTFLKS